MPPHHPAAAFPNDSNAEGQRDVSILRSTDVVDLHDRCLDDLAWPDRGSEPHSPSDIGDVWHWIRANHFWNSSLWAEEDLARRRTVADAEIAANKRAIDRFNQARNDATERIDELLLISLGLVDAESARTDAPVSRSPSGARLNSETAGSMVDRLSILALKVHAMRQQCERTDVDQDHRTSSRVKLERLLAQRGDLAACLDDLLRDCREGRACFKVYRQFKMYNDPRLNPALVAEQRG